MVLYQGWKPVRPKTPTSRSLSTCRALWSAICRDRRAEHDGESGLTGEVDYPRVRVRSLKTVVQGYVPAVFELVGATSACALAYILPPLCYIKLSKKSWRTVPAIVCSAFGFVVMLISLVQVGLAIGSVFCSPFLTLV